MLTFFYFQHWTCAYVRFKEEGWKYFWRLVFFVFMYFIIQTSWSNLNSILKIENWRKKIFDWLYKFSIIYKITLHSLSEERLLNLVNLVRGRESFVGLSIFLVYAGMFPSPILIGIIESEWTEGSGTDILLQEWQKILKLTKDCKQLAIKIVCSCNVT